MFRVTALAALLLTTAPAHADPVTLAGLASISASISTFAASSALAGFAVNLAGSLLLSSVANALRPKPKISQVKQGLQVPESLVPYRYWYGETLCTPTPLQMAVDDADLYGCVLLNSRPSQEVTTVYLDGRPLVFTGDIYDLSGGGGLANNGRFADYILRVWVGLGDQTAPPAQLVSEAPGSFAATDAWKGRTVLWYKIVFGDPKQASWKWPSRPPQITALGKWSKVYDPRDVAQDPDDPATWVWSDNQALCLMDFYRQNPIKSYPLTAIHLPTFEAAADVADQAVTLAAGSVEPRYRVAGVIVFEGSEIEAQAQPLHDAGASRPTWIGGQMGIVPGCAIDSSYTIADVLDVDGMEYTRYRPAADMVTTVRTTYVAPDRRYEPAELSPYSVPGAQTADGGLERVVNLDLTMVQSATQAKRLQKMTGLVGRQQRQISVTLPPDAFDLISGSVVTVDLPSPFTARNGTYEVQSISPVASILGEDGQVALRCPVVLREYAAAVFAWTTADEETTVSPTFDPDRPEIAPGGSITTTTGTAAALNIGSGLVPRIRFAFAPSTSAVDGYEWQFRVTGADWQAGGTIDADVRDGSAQVFGYVGAVTPGEDYDIRVRAYTGSSASDWVEVLAVTAVAPTAATTSETLSGFAVAAATLDAGGGGSQPGISFDWASTGLEYATGIQYQVRLTSSGVVKARGSTAATEDLTFTIPQAFKASTAYEVRAKPIKPYGTAWTAWTAVTTNSASLTPGDVSGYGGGVSDATFAIQDDADATKQAKFQVSGIAAGTTRTFTLPDGSGTVVVTGLGYNIASTWTFSAAVSTFGSSSAAATYGLGSGATTSGATKAVNIGTSGLSGSITNVQIGSAVAGALGGVTVNSDLFVKCKAPTNFTGAATIAAADIQNGIITYSGAAATLTLPTGANLDALFTTMTTDTAFEFSIINTGSGTATIAAGTGGTIVGAAGIAAGTTGLWRMRKTGTAAYTFYRAA